MRGNVWLRRACLSIVGISSCLTLTSNALSEEPRCTTLNDRSSIAEMYTKLNAQFDLSAAAQTFLEASQEAYKLKENEANCRRENPAHDSSSCVAEKQAYAERLAQRDAAKHHFSTAIEMQDYLMTLKWRTGLPLCKP